MEVLQRTANRGSISTGSYEIANSLKLERANSEYLNRTPSSNGNQQIFTFSSWVKFSYINPQASEWSTLFSAGDYAANSPSFRIGHHTNNSLQVSFYTNSAYTGYYRTDALHRDIAAWYHFVCAIDTTQGTNTNRVKIYVNGVLAPTTSVVSHVTQNYNSGVNTGIAHRIGHGVNMETYASEYVAETHFVDGQALAPTEFGEFDEDSGIWKPKAYTGSYGTNGFYLDFSDSANLGDDVSGNGNDFTLNNITAADQATDTPTNNFATSNFLISQGGFFVTTEGGTKCVLGTSGPGNNTGGVSALSTIAVSKGKWYMEMKNDVANDSVDTYARFGFVDVGTLENGGVDGKVIARPGSAGGAYFGGTGGGRYHYNNTAQGNSTTWIRQVMGMALDLDNRKAYFHIDGTYTNSGDPANGTDNGGQYDMNTGGDGIYVDETWVLGASAYNLGIFLMNWGGFTTMPISSAETDANGYGTFEYAPPSGYYALCTKNLAEFG
jgi:hypothetical protein